jgi:hypothetical protein
VFAGEVLMGLIILALTRRMADTPLEAGAHLTWWARCCRRWAWA